jgi:hypothetical protein
MGYTTDFTGSFRLDKPLNVKQYNLLKAFAERDHREESGVPGYYCQWVPTEDGDGIEWDGGEKFYEYIAWLEYLIGKFLVPWGYTLNGTVEWIGEDRSDVGMITVVDNVVSVKRGRITYE